MKEVIKETLGDRARDIIVQDLGLKFNGNHYSCPYPDHNDEHPSTTWYPHAFHCWSCSGGANSNQYDIFTHYEQHHGMTFSESIQALCDELGIQNNGRQQNSNIVTRAKQSEVYKKKLSEVIPVIKSKSKLFDDKKICIDVARSYFMAVTTEKEFLMHGYESVDGVWTPLYTKKRLLDGSMYNINGSEMKEINIKDGKMCFYGINTIYNSKGELKKYGVCAEGQTDALRIATELSKEGKLEQIAVFSVPTGGGSFTKGYNNSPTFRKWLKNTCLQLVLVPDADDAGLKMVKQASELNSDKIKWVNLTKINGVRFENNKGKDVSDVLNAFKMPVSSILRLCDSLPVEGLIDASDAEIDNIKEGISSGFLTHDYNDMGLKEGRLTLLTGFRGQGKTTLARQIVMCSAMQGHKNFCFFGEANEGQELARFSRMCYLEESDILTSATSAGRKIYKPSAECVDRFKSKFGDKITFFCKDHIKDGVNFFDAMMEKMVIAKDRGCKLFLIDNMMIITSSSSDKDVFSEQKRIVMALKNFAIKHRVHILLIAHPKSGEGMQKISGAMEQENLADTILYYMRMDGLEADNGEGIPPKEGEKVSAVLVNRKVRDEGDSRPCYLQWDDNVGVVREVTSTNLPELAQEASAQYNKDGWWSKPVIHPISVEDQPPRLTKGE